jgi:hypothetical protein
VSAPAAGIHSFTPFVLISICPPSHPDYEEVARRRPKDLSRSIQQGIPAVIRGTMVSTCSLQTHTKTRRLNPVSPYNPVATHVVVKITRPRSQVFSLAQTTLQARKVDRKGHCENVSWPRVLSTGGRCWSRESFQCRKGLQLV